MTQLASLKTLSVAAFLAAAAISSHAAPGIIFDRGLPEANLNNVAGADRSNVSWGFGASGTPGLAYYSGDFFRLGQDYVIHSLTTWATIGPVPLAEGTLESRFSSLSLFTGTGVGPMTERMQGNTVGNATDNPNISVTQVTYANGADYQGSGGAFINLLEITFTNLKWKVQADVDYYFSVVGVDNPDDQTYFPWFMHASNAERGGVPADGANDRYNWFYTEGGQLFLGGEINSQGNGWDKSSDINVVLRGELPLPGTLALGLLGLISVGAARFARRA
jgi:hypothetical protein